MRKSHAIAMLTLCLTGPRLLFADFSYQQTTQITGGSLVAMLKVASVFSSQAKQANQPITTSIYLKGNRMARISSFSTEIIDLDAERITHIDNTKHTYTVMTFDQMKEQIAAAEAEVKKKQAEAPAPQPSSSTSDVQMNFDVHVRKTGAEKQVDGLAANEAILTMVMKATDPSTAQSGTMGITNDMWLVPEVSGYAELRDFNMRYAAKMGTVLSGSGMDMTKMFSQQPGAGEALKGLAKEMQEIQGVTVLQVMRMGMTSNGQPLPAASEAPLPASSSSDNGVSAHDAAQQAAAQSISSRLGALGGFGGFGHKKKTEDAPPTADTQNGQQQPTSAVLMESQTETSGFSSAPVDASHFDIPGGYKQIQPDLHLSN